MGSQSRIIPITNVVIDIPADGMFVSADWRVISRDGDNYYKACGQIVLDNEDGSTTSCVKPIYHVTWQHEDFEGRVSSLRHHGIMNIDSQTRGRARDVLKGTGLDEEQIYNALNALFYDGISLTKES